MMDLEGFDQLVQALRERGFNDATAQKYAAIIGDTPEENAAGQWVIRDDHGQVLDTIAPIMDVQ